MCGRRQATGRHRSCCYIEYVLRNSVQCSPNDDHDDDDDNGHDNNFSQRANERNCFCFFLFLLSFGFVYLSEVILQSFAKYDNYALCSLPFVVNSLMDFFCLRHVHFTHTHKHRIVSKCRSIDEKQREKSTEVCILYFGSKILRADSRTRSN